MQAICMLSWWIWFCPSCWSRTKIAKLYASLHAIFDARTRLLMHMHRMRLFSNEDDVRNEHPSTRTVPISDAIYRARVAQQQRCVIDRGTYLVCTAWQAQRVGAR